MSLENHQELMFLVHKVIIPKNTRTGTATEFEVQGDHQNDTN